MVLFCMEGDDSVSYSRDRYLASWGPWVLGLTAVLNLNLGKAQLVTAGLYECRNDAGTIIYTDSPAQLDRCQPVGSGGPSRLGVVGGAAPLSPVPPAIPIPAPPTSVPPDPGSLAPPAASSAMTPSPAPPPSSGSPPGAPTGTAEDPPCAPGVIPFNPLSGPPCAATSPPPPPTRPGP